MISVFESFEKVMDERHHASSRQTLRLSKLELNLFSKIPPRSLNHVRFRAFPCTRGRVMEEKEKKDFKRSGSAKRLRF